MRKRIICLLMWIGCYMGLNAQVLKPLYSAKDSVKIEKFLSSKLEKTDISHTVIHFANLFKGIPYVASTLEIADPERLVLNLEGLDCTTYVEVVTALTLCSQNNQSSFKDFLYYLQKLRYLNGVINEYPSRNHYYSSWILNGEKQNLIHEISVQDYPHISPLTATQKLAINFMSTHTNLYKALVKHPNFIPQIQKAERALTGQVIRYIPTKALGNSKYLRQVIHDGDILALVTQRAGLDVSHLGFAQWGSDGFLHLLNASSLHHQVVLEKKSLQSYMKSQRLQLGVRVIRITPNKL